VSGDEAFPGQEHYEKLFGPERQARLDIEPLAAADDAPAAAPSPWPKVEIAGVVVDFAGPLEIVQAARAICAAPDREARGRALDQVPPHFRDSVRILVEREFYHRSRAAAPAFEAATRARGARGSTKRGRIGLLRGRTGHDSSE